MNSSSIMPDRKLFAKGFLLGMAPLCFITIGNCSRRVSYPAWHHCLSPRQETVREWFPTRHGTIVFHHDRKLFAKGFPTRHGTIVFHHDRKLFANGFLSGMAPLCFTAIGNCSRRVSYSAWHHCVSPRQETVCEGFPTRHGTIVFHRGRKLFAKGFLLGMAPLFSNTIGNCSQRFFYSHE